MMQTCKKQLLLVIISLLVFTAINGQENKNELLWLESSTFANYGHFDTYEGFGAVDRFRVETYNCFRLPIMKSKIKTLSITLKYKHKYIVFNSDSLKSLHNNITILPIVSYYIKNFNFSFGAGYHSLVQKIETYDNSIAIGAKHNKDKLLFASIGYSFNINSSSKIYSQISFQKEFIKIFIQNNLVREHSDYRYSFNIGMEHSIYPMSFYPLKKQNSLRRNKMLCDFNLELWRLNDNLGEKSTYNHLNYSIYLGYFLSEKYQISFRSTAYFDFNFKQSEGLFYFINRRYIGDSFFLEAIGEYNYYYLDDYFSVRFFSFKPSIGYSLQLRPDLLLDISLNYALFKHYTEGINKENHRLQILIALPILLTN